jgi:3-phosphoshikimate 1-carboxyvinyltransferase
VLGAAAEGETVIKNAARLRIKESDRLCALARNLRELGAEVRETEDGLVIRGGKPLTGGAVSGFNDHRIVMAFAVFSALCAGPVTISGAEAVSKSYPSFFEDFKKLGGKFDVV